MILQATDAAGNVAQDVRVIRVDGGLKVGHFSVTFEEFSAPVAGLPVTVLRTYDSRRRDETLDFGYGWSVDYQNVRVEEYLRTVGGGPSPFKRSSGSSVREFDGAWGDTWYEAKSSWYQISSNPRALAKFQSITGEQRKIASAHNSQFVIVSNGSIPSNIKVWLSERGIRCIEML